MFSFFNCKLESLAGLELSNIIPYSGCIIYGWSNNLAHKKIRE